MRSLSGTLTAAQKARSGRPYVVCEVDDFRGDRGRLRFTRWYSGSEVDGFIAAAVPGDGSLVRWRVDPSGTDTVYRSRVTSPGSGSTYSSWTSVQTVGVNCGIAVAAVGASIFAFVVDADQVSIRLWASFDNGAGWTDLGVVLTALAAVGAMACAFKDGNELALFWAEGATVYRSVWTSGGGFGARTAWSLSVASVTGLAAEYQGDYGVIVTGTETTTTHPKVWACIFGDGLDQANDTWSALVEITAATSGSGVAYRSPAIELISGIYRVYFVETYSGSLAYSRLHQTTFEPAQNLKQDLWAEPWAFDYANNDFGVAACNSGGTAMFLVSSDGVWNAPATPAALSLTADVVEAEVLQDKDGARVRVVLDNGHGRYSLAGSDIDELAIGRRLKLSFGFRTTAGLEASTGPGYWIMGVTQEWESPPAPNTGGGRRAARSVTVVEARDGWHLLDAWRARRQLQWAAGVKSIAQLLDYVFARAGMEFTSGGSSSGLTGLQPAFTVHPGESGATVVRRLLEKVPDRIRMRSAQGAIVNPLAADSADYTYGTDHRVYACRLRSEPLAYNRARVFGLAVFDEGFNFGELELAELVRNVHDETITTTGQATNRAAYALRQAEVEGDGGELEAPMQCGAELWDVVSVTEGVTGASATKRRCNALRLRWRAESSIYDVRLGLGAA